MFTPTFPPPWPYSPCETTIRTSSPIPFERPRTSVGKMHPVRLHLISASNNRLRVSIEVWLMFNVRVGVRVRIGRPIQVA